MNNDLMADINVLIIWQFFCQLLIRNMKCSGRLSAPALFQGSVRHQRTMFLRFEISQLMPWFVLVIVNNNRNPNWFNRCNFETALVLFQILSSIAKEKECAQACDDFNLCTNYTFLGPHNPLRWPRYKPQFVSSENEMFCTIVWPDDLW